jgi:hypothetical protein
MILLVTIASAFIDRDQAATAVITYVDTYVLLLPATENLFVLHFGAQYKRI